MELAALPKPEEGNGGTGLATTVSAEACTEAELLQAYQAQHTTVAPGFRWSKPPAAIAPGWLEKPERSAALARLTVVGWLVYNGLQRQVRRYLRPHAQPLPGQKGRTTTPPAAVGWALFAQIALRHFWIGGQEVAQGYGLQSPHLLICDALGLDHAWYEAASAPTIEQFGQTP